MKTTATWIGLALGAAALILQFAITIPLRLDKGDTIFGAVIFYFSFFTILTNLGLAFVYASELWPRQALSWFRSPTTRAMFAGAIALVGIFYHLILAETWDPTGLSLVCDIALHYVTPVVYVLWWVVFMRHGVLKWSQVPAMLLPPTIYLIYAMVRGAIVGEYPYPILEANRIGYGAVALNVLMVLAGLAALCSIVVALDRLFERVDMPGP